MEVKVYGLVNMIVLNFSSCFCDGQFVVIYCDSCCKRLLILSILLVTVSVSDSFPSEANSEQLGLTSNESIPCLAGSSIFFLGSCISCTQPYLHGSNVLNFSSKISSPSIKDDQMFMCSDSDNIDLETAKINEGKTYLNGTLLRVVTIERQPFVKVNNEFTGTIFEFVYALREKYNFTSKIFLPFDGNWGSEGKNGNWSGMVGLVQRDMADLGAAAFSITLERAMVVDFSIAFHQEPAGILIPAPRPGEKLTILIRPLQAEVWLAVFTTVCVLVPSLFVMHIVSLRLTRHADIISHKPVNMLRLILDIIQFIIGSFAQEGLVSPVNKTTRFVVAIWWFLSLVLANVYCGYMVSFLSAPKLYDIVDNLEGLIHQRELRWTYRKNTALEDLFQSSSSGVYKAIGMGARETDLTKTDVAGVEKVLKGHFAFLKEKSFLDVAIGNDFDISHKCRLTIATETFFTAGLALIVQKGCTFLKLLDREILNAATTGLMEKWKMIHWPRNLFCVNAAQYIVSTQPKARKLSLNDCQGANFLLLCGLSLASIAFIVEICKRLRWKCCFRRRTASDDDSDEGDELKGYRIIVIPVKEDIYHKIHKLNLFKAGRKGVIDK